MSTNLPTIETYIYELEWGIHLKRLFLGGPKNSSMEIRRALIEVEAEKPYVEDWVTYLDWAIEIFRQHGFVRVEP